MIDLKISDTGGIVIQNGDLVLTESTVQHQKDLINAEKGWWKFNPTRGVGLNSWLNDTNARNLPGAIRSELERDGQEVENISVANGKLTINSSYP